MKLFEFRNNQDSHTIDFMNLNWLYLTIMLHCTIDFMNLKIFHLDMYVYGIILYIMANKSIGTWSGFTGHDHLLWHSYKILFIFYNILTKCEKIEMIDFDS